MIDFAPLPFMSYPVTRRVVALCLTSLLGLSTLPNAQAGASAQSLYQTTLTLQKRSSDLRSSQQLDALMDSQTPGTYAGLSLTGILDFSQETGSWQQLFYRHVGEQLKGDVLAFYDQLSFEQANGTRYGAQLIFSHPLRRYRVQYQLAYTHNNTRFQLVTNGPRYTLSDHGWVGALSISMPLSISAGQHFMPYSGVKYERIKVKALNTATASFTAQTQAQPQFFMGFNYQWQNIFHLFGLGLSAGYRVDLGQEITPPHRLHAQQEAHISLQYHFSQAQVGWHTYLLRADQHWHVTGSITTRWWF